MQQFNEQQLKPAAKMLGDNAEDIADEITGQLKPAAKAVAENSVPVAQDISKTYLKPGAKVSALLVGCALTSRRLNDGC